MGPRYIVDLTNMSATLAAKQAGYKSWVNQARTRAFVGWGGLSELREAGSFSRGTFRFRYIRKLFGEPHVFRQEGFTEGSGDNRQRAHSIVLNRICWRKTLG